MYERECAGGLGAWESSLDCRVRMLGRFLKAVRRSVRLSIICNNGLVEELSLSSLNNDLVEELSLLSQE
jgi:hypothetical protein